MKDDKTNPLLDQNVNKEYELLNEEYNKFNFSIEEINKELDKKNVDENVILTKILTKLKNIKTHMEKINDKIHLIKNYMKDDQSRNQNSSIVILNKIKIMSENISRGYESVNRTFLEKVEMAKKNIQMEIEEKSNRNENINDNLNSTTKVVQKLDQRVRMDIDRLQERQLDLEKITKISFQLLELSRDMRREAEKQGKIVSSIEDHVTLAQTKTDDATSELNKKNASQSSYIKLYFWIVTILCVVLFIVFFYLYWKYLRNKSQ